MYHRNRGSQTKTQYSCREGAHFSKHVNIVPVLGSSVRITEKFIVCRLFSSCIDIDLVLQESVHRGDKSVHRGCTARAIDGPILCRGIAILCTGVPIIGVGSSARTLGTRR